MKRLLISLATAVCLTACSAQTEADFRPYADRMDSLQQAMTTLEANFRRTAATEKDTTKLKAQVAAAEAEAEKLTEERKALFLDIAKRFKATTFPARYVPDMMWYLSYDQLADVMDPQSGYYNEKEMQNAKRYFDGLTKRKPGSTVKELTMPDINGKSVRLTDWVGHGKYVLVDFWASWCGPCRMEMPNVVAAYAKYAGPKLEIVGVSFDSNAAAWKSAVAQLGMTWPQMSDLKGWKSAGADVYGIMSIPANILFDPQGRVIAIDLRGNDLQSKLAELIK